MSQLIQIRNKRTGEVKFVSPQEAMSKYGLSQEKVASKLQAAQQIDQATNPDYVDPKEKAQKETTAKNVFSLTDELKRLYNQKLPSGEYPRSEDAGDLSSGKPGMPSFISNMSTRMQILLNRAPDAKTYNRLKNAFTASLKEVTGDTGILTDQDYERLNAALPNFGDSDESALKNWESIDRLLLEKLGSVGKFSYIPATPEEKQREGQQLAAEAQNNPNSRGLQAQLGVTQADTPQSEYEQGNTLGDNYAALLNQHYEKQGLKLTPEAYDYQVKLMNQFNNAITDWSLFKADGVEMLKNASKTLGKIFRPAKAGSLLRDTVVDQAQAAGKTISGDQVAKSIDTWAEEAARQNPTLKNKIAKFVEGAKEIYKGQKVEPTRAFQDWFLHKEGFTQAGRARQTLKASYHRAMRDALRPLLEDVAPGFEEGTKLIARGLQRAKTIRKLTYPAAMGISGAIGIGLLNIPGRVKKLLESNQ